MKTEELRIWMEAPPPGKAGHAGQVRQLCRNDGQKCRISISAQHELQQMGVPLVRLWPSDYESSAGVAITREMSAAAHKAGVPNKALAMLQTGSDLPEETP